MIFEIYQLLNYKREDPQDLKKSPVTDGRFDMTTRITRQCKHDRDKTRCGLSHIFTVDI